MDINDVYLNHNWFPLKDIDIKKEGYYLCRLNNTIYENCFSILFVTDKTWKNGLWVFLNGHTISFNDGHFENYEVCGPIIFRKI